jgi:hypothetical protein
MLAPETSTGGADPAAGEAYTASVTNETSSIVAGLRAIADAAVHYVRRVIAQSAHAAERIVAEAARARELVRAWRETDPSATAAPQGESAHCLNVVGLHSQLDDLAKQFAEQQRALAILDEPVAASPIDCAALEAELEALKGRVRHRRGRISERAAAQGRGARNVETRARRLEQRLDKLRDGRTRLLALELAITGVDATLIASEVEVGEAAAQLAVSERELTSCAKESALLRERGQTAAVARDLAAQRLHRLRAKVAALEDDANGLRAHDVMSPSEGASREAALSELLSQLRAMVDECAACMEDTQRPEGGTRPAASACAANILPQLDRKALRVPVERRLRMLEALAEIRVEETQAMHAAGTDDPMRAHAAFARVSSTHIRLLLDEHERAWIFDSLEAVGHEQGARLSHRVDHEPDSVAGQLHGAVTAWRRCDERLEETAARTRAAQLELASLRATLAPGMARTDAELREQSARIRERQNTLRVRTRRSERAASRLRVTRQRQRALAKSVRRARDALDRALARIESVATTDILGRLAALEREVETAAALIAGLRSAHEQIVLALTAMEHELLDLSLAQRTATMPAAPPATGAQQTPTTEEPWTRARMEIDIAALADELEGWKARHSQLEQRVEAQAGLLASVESAQRQDEALAEFRLELEHARSIAAVSLERALGVTGGAPRVPSVPDAAGGDEAEPPSPARPQGAR